MCSTTSSAAGATIVTTAENRPVALLCRRTTFERTLWNRAAAQQRITLLCGHVDRIERDRGADRWGDGATAARCPPAC